MIHSLRKRHRRASMVLAVLVPGLFAIGLGMRTEWPDAMKIGTGPRSAQVGGIDDLWSTDGARTTLVQVRDGSRRIVIEGPDPFVAIIADPLLYWAVEERDFGDSLPEGAVFLGPFDSSSGVILSSTPDVTEASGRLIVYSLARQEIVAVSRNFDWSEFSLQAP